MSRFLCHRHCETRDIASAVDVTGRSEREVEKIERGMLRNASDDYFVDDLSGEEVEAAGGVKQ